MNVQNVHMIVCLLLVAAVTYSHAAGGAKKNQLLEQEVAFLKENLSTVWESMLELRQQLERLESEERVHHHHHHYHHYYPDNSTDFTFEDDDTNQTNVIDHDHMFEHQFSYLAGGNPHNASSGKHYHHHHHLHHQHPKKDGNTDYINTQGTENYHHHHHNQNHDSNNGGNSNHNSNSNNHSNHNHNGNGNSNGNHNGNNNHHDGHNHNNNNHRNGNDDFGLVPMATDADIIAQAICQVRPNRALPTNERQNIRGTAHFKQKGNILEIDLNIRGFLIAQHTSPDLPDEHAHVLGLHVHEFGDLSNGCESAGEHYNPPRGDISRLSDAPKRRVGDLGNIECDETGKVETRITNKLAALNGTHSIIGKTLVVHENRGEPLEDEAGLTTTSAGKRLACCVITKMDN